MAAVLVLGLVASILHLPTPVHGYIPARPVNDTSSLDSSSDLLHLAFQNGVYNTPISRQLWAEGFDDSGNYTNISTIVPWTKFSKGVLLHFDETLRNQPPTNVPWIAMISCDTNGTNPSDEDDIFTITRDLGAQAALLYSLTSEGCQITEEYLTFEKVLDVYATTTLQGSRIIEQQFVNVNAAAAAYDSLTLNNSASIAQALLDSNALSVIGNVPINASSTATDDDEGDETAMSTVDPTAIAAATSPSVFDPDNDGSTSSAPDALVTSSETAPSLFSGTSAAAGRLVRRQAAPTVPTGSPPTRTSSSASATSTAFGSSQNYLGAVMAAANVTVGGLNPPSASASAASGGGGGGAKSTSMAMIILYAITGVVTALFLVVIMSGAIRAARNPQVYGPRLGGAGGFGGSGDGEGQTRASGLTRAILDTFPVVKFGNGRAQSEERRDEEAGPVVGDDDDDERKKAAAAAGEGEQIELAVMPSMAPAIPMTRSRSADGLAPRGVPPVAAPLAAAAAADARPRAASRASTSAESFHSAASTPVAVPVARRHSTSSLEPVPATPSSTAAASSSATTLDAAAPVAAVVSPSQAAVEATLASAADAAEADLCPICFCDFEDGDELRVLPCDNRHRFHSACIDPFLLNVSRLCPLCRLDLATVAAPLAGTNDAQQQQQQQQDGDGAAARTSEGDGAEGERHEEERVIRHLRALLHRGSHSSPAGSARPTVPGASSTSAGGGGGGTAAAGSESADGVEAGFRNRFASYVTARRGRTRRGSSFSGPSRLGSSFSAWAAGPSGDGRIGAPV
ncbi:uncharacterized protein RHOBADRAFT_54930 [Rhodotorula graminis WP1]|uniref:RING-type domain-containing protein n=1 Tax=Rhodotorula graminis (strain WP1) TaxID=578459 RepID=A0A0P9F216_RHOGW|nr:uncharacterized protein RHOBADRAFT_54930 [Rhodotorula graminis WP1]KPV73743.1 hypothetical protein RHOBADRAFT_54930 [Rhodotorula graminis WP1]